jgi:hypothetical protein
MEPSASEGYIDSRNRECTRVVSLAKLKEAKVLAAVAAGGLLLSPALASASSKKRAAAISLSADPIFSFTPANADPKLAASLAGKGMSLTDFKFTPAPAKGRPSQVRVAIRAPASNSAQRNITDANAATPAASNLAPVSYNLGVGVGWKRFAVAGDVAKVKDADPAKGSRESAVVGVSYSLKRFTGRVAVGAERGDGDAIPALRKADNVSLDLGGSYSLSRRVALTGGVRYSIEHDPMAKIQDNRRDSQAVYVGTAFKF